MYPVLDCLLISCQCDSDTALPGCRRSTRASPGSPGGARICTPHARGLHSFTLQLNRSAFRGIGDACRGGWGGDQGVLGDSRGGQRSIWCQKRLRLS